MHKMISVLLTDTNDLTIKYVHIILKKRKKHIVCLLQEFEYSKKSF